MASPKLGILSLGAKTTRDLELIPQGLARVSHARALALVRSSCSLALGVGKCVSQAWLLISKPVLVAELQQGLEHSVGFHLEQRPTFYSSTELLMSGRVHKAFFCRKALHAWIFLVKCTP